MTLSQPAPVDGRIALEGAAAAQSVDAQLVTACMAGDGGAFDQIVRLHSSRIFNYIHHMTRHAQDAEDLTQQTFIKAYRALDRFDTSRSLVAWLLTIARRTALNHFRDSRRFEEFSEETADVAASPAREAEHHDRVDNLWAEARRLLPAKQYEVLWLRFGEDLSVEETARVTGLTKTHIKILVFRARHKLEKLRYREAS